MTREITPLEELRLYHDVSRACLIKFLTATLLLEVRLDMQDRATSKFGYVVPASGIKCPVNAQAVHRNANICNA